MYSIPQTDAEATNNPPVAPAIQESLRVAASIEQDPNKDTGADEVPRARYRRASNHLQFLKSIFAGGMSGI